MTAFNTEALLLLAFAFLAGLALGLFLGRRLRAGAGDDVPDRARPPSEPPQRLVNGDFGAPAVPRSTSFAPAQSALPARAGGKAEDAAARPEPEPDLFTRLLASAPPLPPEEEDPHEPPPPRERGASESHPGVRPPTLDAPEGGTADDLKLLKGIGPQNERRLHALGIFHFRQIAAWTPEEVMWVGSYLAFPGRIEREDWIGQARGFADGTPPPEGPARRKR
ncbi:hypothetical protein [Xanthobacter dioxanivorans]|uniref:hypothetical protein n=1 Tax=Xanthobacter dioxanivorans TaxID=2528964 RepID=UPI0038CD3DE7